MFRVQGVALGRLKFLAPKADIEDRKYNHGTSAQRLQSGYTLSYPLRYSSRLYSTLLYGLLPKDIPGNQAPMKSPQAFQAPSGCPEFVASSEGLTRLILKPSARDSDVTTVSRSAKVTLCAPTWGHKVLYTVSLKQYIYYIICMYWYISYIILSITPG